MASAKNEAERELIASLAMMEFADVDHVDDIVSKSLSLIKRIIHVRRRSESTLLHEIRKIEQKSRTKKIEVLNNIDIEQGIAVEQDGDTDLTLELLRQRQIEIRKLRGYDN